MDSSNAVAILAHLTHAAASLGVISLRSCGYQLCYERNRFKYVPVYMPTGRLTMSPSRCLFHYSNIPGHMQSHCGWRSRTK